MFSTTPFSDFRTGNPSEIKYTWTRTTRDFAVLVAICPKVNELGKLVGVYSAYKQAENLDRDPEEFAKHNKWYADLEYEICEQINNTPFAHFDLETFISIHNTSIRTRA
jgi:hypothetical protein